MVTIFRTSGQCKDRCAPLIPKNFGSQVDEASRPHGDSACKGKLALVSRASPGAAERAWPSNIFDETRYRERRHKALSAGLD